MHTRKEPAVSPPPARLFQLENVGFEAGGRPLLQGLSLAIDAGVVTGLIGPNGSGKSTLVKLLARQADPSAGSIAFLDRPLRAYGDREFARRLAYLPQTPPATDGMTGRELTALGRYPHHGALGKPSAEDRTAIEAAITATDTAEFCDRPVDELSGGERQRVWLAMLIAQGADCLVLDEPTSALDVAHQAEMLALVRRISRENGFSVLVVLHDINMAARICDRIIALKAGRIVADGKPDAIMTPECLHAIYDVQMGVFRTPSSDQPVGYVA